MHHQQTGSENSQYRITNDFIPACNKRRILCVYSVDERRRWSAYSGRNMTRNKIMIKNIQHRYHHLKLTRKTTGPTCHIHIQNCPLSAYNDDTWFLFCNKGSCYRREVEMPCYFSIKAGAETLFTIKYSTFKSVRAKQTSGHLGTSTKQMRQCYA